MPAMHGGGCVTGRRLGGYILPGDTTWLVKSLSAYYPLLDDLVVAVPDGGIGWRGQRLPVHDVMRIIADVDHRRIARVVSGSWIDAERPMLADTAQRQAALDSMRDSVDWVLKIDSDEYLPDPGALVRAIDAAEAIGIDAVEWPMRVLYRRTRRSVYEVVGYDAESRYDYPGAVAVRAGSRVVDARRVEGRFLRAVIEGDDVSLQIVRDATSDEHRWPHLAPEHAIIHDSWARSVRATWRKVRGWGHAEGLRGVVYFAITWFPSPITWRFLRDIHPFSRGLWPRLARRRPTPELTE